MAGKPMRTDQSGGFEPRGQVSRVLYLIPLVLLLAAIWSFASRSSAGPAFAKDFYVDDPYAYESGSAVDTRGETVQPKGMSQNEPSGEFVLETSQDDENPRRFRKVGNLIEDAATGIRRPLPENGKLVRVAPLSNAQLPPDLRFGYGPRPSRLVIPQIGVDADVTTIGLDRNRALAVPRRAAVAGWWSGGFVPGETGPTVVVGHYDSKTAPGVFARLDQLSAGETIDIKLTDGSEYRYFVTEVQRLKKSTFPSERVYGPTDSSTLRLVTCGGKFDRRTGHYVDNTIVYAELLYVTTPVDLGATTFATVVPTTATLTTVLLTTSAPPTTATPTIATPTTVPLTTAVVSAPITSPLTAPTSVPLVVETLAPTSPELAP